MGGLARPLWLQQHREGKSGENTETQEELGGSWDHCQELGFYSQYSRAGLEQRRDNEKVWFLNDRPGGCIKAQPREE